MNKKVMLAMSGGVDSSCALLLLKNMGYEVIGATMHLYDNEDIGLSNKTCCSLSDVEDAKAVAARFGVTHYVFNFKQRFKTDVIDRFNREYLEGRTPNPCVDCNRFLKFGALFERAEELGCDFIATGHYARVVFDDIKKRYLLKKAKGKNGANSKDQSYVLYDLTSYQLAHTLFPLGDLEKSEVRSIAENNGLINSKKSDSQDICFIPDKDYAGFINRSVGTVSKSGDIIDKNKNVLGRHNGIINYTIGQRKGIGISFGKPMYVIDKDHKTNTVTIGEEKDLYKTSLIAEDLNFISADFSDLPISCTAKTRYKQEEQPCIVYPDGENRVRVVFEKPQRAVAKGQRIVFYDADTVVGGGVIIQSV